MTAASVEQAPSGRDVPRVVWSWALFDWANSAFTTLVVTFIYATYFTKSFGTDPELTASWWGRAVSLSALAIAILSPVLGAAADRAGARKRFLMVTTLVCVVGTTALAFVVPGTPHAVTLALGIFVVANIAFEIGNVFYNSFLSEIASPARIGRISGYGWGLGYAGGLVCMAVALVGFIQPAEPWFGISTANGWNVRATNILVALWFVVFALPLFLAVPERRKAELRFEPLAAFRELGRDLPPSAPLPRDVQVPGRAADLQRRARDDLRLRRDLCGQRVQAVVQPGAGLRRGAQRGGRTRCVPLRRGRRPARRQVDDPRFAGRRSPVRPHLRSGPRTPPGSGSPGS